MSQVFKKKQAAGDDRPSADDLREQRLEDVRTVAERFIFDLGRLIAGHETDFHEYVVPSLAATLVSSVEPFLETGDAMRPNFGDYGEMRVEGNLLDPRVPISAQIEFTDQSVRESAGGDLIPTPRRRMVLTMTIDPQEGMITAVSLVAKDS